MPSRKEYPSSTQRNTGHECPCSASRRHRGCASASCTSCSTCRSSCGDPQGSPGPRGRRSAWLGPGPFRGEPPLRDRARKSHLGEYYLVGGGDLDVYGCAAGAWIYSPAASHCSPSAKKLNTRGSSQLRGLIDRCASDPPSTADGSDAPHYRLLFVQDY